MSDPDKTTKGAHRFVRARMRTSLVIGGSAVLVGGLVLLDATGAQATTSHATFIPTSTCNTNDYAYFSNAAGAQIPGTSVDPSFVGAFPLQSVTFNVTATTLSKFNFGDVTFTMAADTTVPQMYSTLASGDHFKTVIFDLGSCTGDSGTHVPLQASMLLGTLRSQTVTATSTGTLVTYTLSYGGLIERANVTVSTR